MACTTCKSPEHLEQCLANPGVLVPSFEFRARTIDLPVDQQDLSYLSTEIKVFAEEQPVTGITNVARSTTSKNFEQPEYQLPADFIALGVCVLINVEPYGMGVDGTYLGTPDQVCALPFDPVSPDVIFDEEDAFNVPNRAQFSLTTQCPAQLSYGHATWKFADWFIKSYRMAVQCQSASNVHEVLNERLIDMGNCCADSSKEGFSTATGDYLEAVRLVNERLLNIWGTPALYPNAPLSTIPALTAANFGLFQPLNAQAELVQGGGGATPRRILTTAKRLAVPPQAFGGLQSAGTGGRWFKFDVPRVIRAHRNIKISLQSLPDDQPNYIRMLREAMVRPCSTPISCATDSRSHRIVVGDASSYTAYARSTMARIPGGRIQIGIGLRGLLLDPSICSDVESIFNNMSAAECTARFGWTGGQCNSLDPQRVAAGSIGKIFGSCGV